MTVPPPSRLGGRRFELPRLDAQQLRGFAERPSTWLAMAILLLPFGSRADASAALVTPADLALALAVAATLLDAARGRRLPLIRSLPALAFLLLGVTTTTVALLSVDARLGLVGVVRFLELFFLVPVTVLVALRTHWDAVVLFGALQLLAVVEGTVGIVQRITRTGADIGGENIRAVGTFGAYNIGALATLSAIAMIGALAWGVVLRGRLRWVGFALAGYLAIPMVLSLSRGIWLAAAAGVFVVLTRGRPARILAGVAVAGISAAVLLPPLVASDSELGARFASLVSARSDPDQSVKDRLSLWSAARQMSEDHPLTGIGPRAFPLHRDAYADLSLLGSSDISDAGGFRRVALESPHNFYLLVAAEQGMIALTAFVATFAMMLLRGLVRAARPENNLSTAMALAGTGMLAHALAEMLTGDLGGPNSVMLALVLGLAGWAAVDLPLQKDYQLLWLERIR